MSLAISPPPGHRWFARYPPLSLQPRMSPSRQVLGAGVAEQPSRSTGHNAPRVTAAVGKVTGGPHGFFALRWGTSPMLPICGPSQMTTSFRSSSTEGLALESRECPPGARSSLTGRSVSSSSTFEASRRRHHRRNPLEQHAKPLAFPLTGSKGVCYKFHEVGRGIPKGGSANDREALQGALYGAFFLSSSRSSASLIPPRGHSSTHASPESDPRDECRW